MATLIALPVASSSLADECVRPPANRTVLFYNRVPKAGSESVIQAMRTRMDGVLQRDGARHRGDRAAAMAAGRAIVGSDQGGIRELILDDETGMLAASGDSASFASKIRRLLDDAGLRKRLGTAARRAVALAH